MITTLGCLVVVVILATLFWFHIDSPVPSRLTWDGLILFKHEEGGPAIHRVWIYTEGWTPPAQSARVLTVGRGRFARAMVQRRIAVPFRKATTTYATKMEDDQGLVVFQNPDGLPVVSYFKVIQRGPYTWDAEINQRLDAVPTREEINTLLARREGVFENLEMLLVNVSGS